MAALTDKIKSLLSRKVKVRSEARPEYDVTDGSNVHEGIDIDLYEEETPINGMQSGKDLPNQYANLAGKVATAGILLAKEEQNDRVSEKAEREFVERLKEYCIKYDLTLKKTMKSGEYNLYDSKNRKLYEAKASGEFVHSGYDLLGQQFKDMLIISAAQFRKNDKIVYPFVRENDPKINDKMQEANLRLSIETMLEEGIEIERIQIKSKKWKHLISEYVEKEELKSQNAQALRNSGVDYNSPDSQAPPSNESKEESKAEDKVEDKKEITAKNEEATESAPANKEGTENVAEEKSKVEEKEGFSIEVEEKRLKDELVLQLGNSNGQMGALLNHNKIFAERNFEIGFTANGEMVNVSNIKPQEDGNIYSLNFKTSELTDGNVFKNQMDIYHSIKNAEAERGELKSVLKDVVVKSEGDYMEFRDLMDKKVEQGLTWSFTSDMKNIFASIEDGDTVKYAQVSLGNEKGQALLKSKAEYAEIAENDLFITNQMSQSYDSLFDTDVHQPAGKKDDPAPEVSVKKNSSLKLKK